MATLYTLDTDVLKRQADDGLRAYLCRIGGPLREGETPPASLRLGDHLARLAGWAQTGVFDPEPPLPGGLPAIDPEVDEALAVFLRIAEALYGSPLRSWNGIDLITAVNAISPGQRARLNDAEIVIVCAACRLKIDAGFPVTLVELAHISGVSPGRIRQVVASGGLRVERAAKEAVVAASDARIWLSARGLLGWVAPAEARS